jgi:hypothetical protein
MNAFKEQRVQRGIAKALAQQARRAVDAQRRQSHAIDGRATVAVDLRTCVGCSTNQNPQAVVDALIAQQQQQ